MLQVVQCVMCKKPPKVGQSVQIAGATICRNCQKLEEEKEVQKTHPAFEAPDFITKNLWLGSMFSDINKEYLQKKNISAIVLACIEGEPRFSDDFAYHKLDIEDTFEEKLLPLLDSTMSFISSHIAKEQGVLVRCAAGISRSASVVIAYIMKTRQWSFERSQDFVRNCRPEICPNPNFVAQLKEYEKRLGLCSTSPPK